MSQLANVTKALKRSRSSKGLTADAIAKAAGCPKESVYKRIYDLRVNEGMEIDSTVRNGTTFYRVAV